jgi:phage terminase large subunit
MLKMKAPKKVVQGSTNSGKTYGIVPIMYDRCLETPRIKVTVVAETLTAVKEGALDIFKNFMMDEGRWDDNKWNASTLTYICENNSKLQFKSFDTVGKAKASGKRQVLFLNEANHIPFDIADTLMIRSEEVWLDFNADMEFWAHTEVLTSDNSEFLKLTYHDNEAVPEATMAELMIKKAKAEKEDRLGARGYWYNWWQVYGLGEIGMLQESVYSVWEVLDKKPDRFTQFVYGLDFGYQHPTALVRVWFWEDELFVEEVIYKTGLTSNPTIDEMRENGVEVDVEIMADHARPEIIKDIQDAGFYVMKADKSVNKGLNFIREKTVYVHADSIHIQSENRKYKYKKVNGVIIDEVKKVDDDAMDAIRYAGAYIKKEYYTDDAYYSF